MSNKIYATRANRPAARGTRYDISFRGESWGIAIQRLNDNRVMIPIRQQSYDSLEDAIKVLWRIVAKGMKIHARCNGTPLPIWVFTMPEIVIE